MTYLYIDKHSSKQEYFVSDLLPPDLHWRVATELLTLNTGCDCSLDYDETTDSYKVLSPSQVAIGYLYPQGE